jgi:predicted small secreted protein
MKSKFANPVRAALLVLFVGLFQVACNTMKGAGRDVERAGEEIQEEAHDAGTPSSRDID